MTAPVHLRAKGWLTSGARIDITAEAFADAVVAARELYAENEALKAHSAALRALVEAITKHGYGSEQANDAYREGFAALHVE